MDLYIVTGIYENKNLKTYKLVGFSEYIFFLNFTGSDNNQKTLQAW